MHNELNISVDTSRISGRPDHQGIHSSTMLLSLHNSNTGVASANALHRLPHPGPSGGYLFITSHMYLSSLMVHKHAVRFVLANISKAVQ